MRSLWSLTIAAGGGGAGSSRRCGEGQGEGGGARPGASVAAASAPVTPCPPLLPPSAMRTEDSMAPLAAAVVTAANAPTLQRSVLGSGRWVGAGHTPHATPVREDGGGPGSTTHADPSETGVPGTSR